MSDETEKKQAFLCSDALKKCDLNSPSTLSLKMLKSGKGVGEQCEKKKEAVKLNSKAAIDIPHRAL